MCTNLYVVIVCRSIYELFNSCFFFFNDTATTEIYTLSLHDALPIWNPNGGSPISQSCGGNCSREARHGCRECSRAARLRSEEHTSELPSRQYIVCRLLLVKKKKKTK